MDKEGFKVTALLQKGISFPFKSIFHFIFVLILALALGEIILVGILVPYGLIW